MNAQTKMSAKGQIVIPKQLRERLEWSTGTELEIEERADGVLLRTPPRRRERITIEEFGKRVPPHSGPPLSLDDMDGAILAEAARRHRAKARRDDA